MLFRLLVTTFMLVQLAGANRHENQLSGEIFGAIQADADQHLYFPFVSHESPLQAVLVATGPDTFESIYIHDAIGYVINRTTKPVYSVTLLMTYKHYTYDVPNTITATFSPFFSATLPGQVNPFYYSTSTGNHMGISFGNSVSISNQANPTPNDSTYVTLDASQWITGGQRVFEEIPRITGTLRNTSHVPVRDARVVIMYAPIGTRYSVCPWMQAALLTTTLQPGESTTYYAYNCGIGTPLPVAQGLVSP